MQLNLGSAPGRLAFLAVVVANAWLTVLPARGDITLNNLAVADADSEGDGLSDFQEIHKYGTDPHKKPTAGTGASDGNWEERRQFTYSIRTIVRVLRPVNIATLNDDYQDVRVLRE